MKQNNLFYRAVTVLLLLSMLMSMLVGCGGEQDTTAANDEEIPDQNVLSLVENGKANYKIVYPISASKKLLSLVDSIVAAVEDATGVAISAEHDSKPAADYELRIGYVKRADSMEVYKGFGDMGDNGYVIEQVGNHIYLYGKNDTATEAAVDHFINGVLSLNLAKKSASIESGIKIRYADHKNEKAEEIASDETYLSFLLNKGTLDETAIRISFTGTDTGWRIQSRSRTESDFEDIGASQRLSLSLGEAPVLNTEPIEVTQEEKTVTVKASDDSYAVLSINPFSLEFYTKSGNVAASFTELTSNSDGSTIMGGLNAGEAVFGTGERFDAVNQRGKNIHMFTKDIWSRAEACYMVIPLLCFSRGSGVFLNTYEEMHLNLGNAGKIDQKDVWTASIVGADIDCYVYTSERISDVIYGYSLLSGFAEPPEEWSYGMLICRNSPDLSQKWSVGITPKENQQGRDLGIYDAIAKMEEYDLPWTGVLAEAWGPYESKKHTDLAELCDYVHALGKKFLVYMRVGSARDSMDGFNPNYLVTMTDPKGITTSLLPSAETNNPDTNPDDPGSYPYLDITNPEAVEWFFNDYWKYLSEEVGVDGCKIDFCETLPEYYQLNYYDENMPTEGSHHWYPTAFCAMFWDMISDKPDSGMCYTRGGGIGSQRAPYMWAGDQKRNYQSLEFQLNACLSSGLSGVPFMSYDMSGYQYGDASQDPYYEAQVFLRGTQYTAFTICMQQHGKVRHAFQFADGQLAKEYVDGKWQTVKDANGNDVYLIEKGEMTYVTDIYRAYVKLHELLTPYINEYSEIACRTGLPVMRHLILHYQDDPKVYNIDDEYMFGDAFLVAPVLDGSYQREVYLPQGRWRDLNDPETVYEGGQTILCEASLARIPVFYNEDARTNQSTTVKQLLRGMEEIFAYLAEVEERIPADRFG